MNNSFERELKARLEIPSGVPESINTRIAETLSNLGQQKQRKLTKRTLIILVARITISCLSTLAAFGQNQINSLLAFVNPLAAKNYDRVKVNPKDHGKTVVNKKVTSKEITLTVKDLAFDGATLIVGFELSKPGGFGNDVDQVEADLMPRFQSTKDSTRFGERSQNAMIGSFLSRKDNGDYQGYTTVYFSNPVTKVQDTYKLYLSLDRIGLHRPPASFTEVLGNWSIDTGLTEKDIYTVTAQTTESNVVHKTQFGQVDSVKIIRSPLSNIINLIGTTSTSDLQSGDGFFILDDKGNCLNYEDGFREGGVNPFVKGGSPARFERTINLLRIPSDTKKLTVLPCRFIYGKETNEQEKRYSADLTKLPVSIKMQDEVIKISGIERSQGKFVMRYTISGLTEDRFFTPIEFDDRNGNRIEETGRKLRMNYETNQGTFEFKTDHPEDVAKVTVVGHEYELMNDYKFDVELR